MDRRRWLERVEVELVGQGLPTGVRARLLAELRDHLDDLMEGDEMATEEEMELRMGDPKQLALAATKEHWRAGWIGRHPLLVFGLGPVPAIILAVTGYMLAFTALGYAIAAIVEDENAAPEGIARFIADALFYGIAFVPFLVVTVVVGWLAVRSRVAGWWAVAAMAQVAILAGLLRVQSIWSDVPEQSQLILGVGVPLMGWRQAAQMLLPLALGWFALRRRRPQPSALV